MKTTLQTLALLCLFIIGTRSFAQVTGVNYIVEYNNVTCHYDCKIVITQGNSTANFISRIISNSSYTLVLDTGWVAKVEQKFNPIVGNTSGSATSPVAEWSVSGDALRSPEVDPAHTFMSFVPAISPSAYFGPLAQGDTVKLFSVSVVADDAWPTHVINHCGYGLRPFENGGTGFYDGNGDYVHQCATGITFCDPASNAPGMQGRNFSNGFTIGGAAQDYKANYPVNYPSVGLSSTPICSAGVGIDLITSGATCVLPLTYQWTGPNNYTGTTEDVNIPAPTSGGTFQVIVTNAQQCKDTFSVDAFPGPTAGTDQILCGSTSTTLTGSPNTGTWTQVGSNAAGATLGTNNNGQINVDFSNPGSYGFVYTANNCSDTVVVNYFVPNAGPDPANVDCFSNGVTSLNATGTGMWSIGAGSAGTVNFADPANPTTMISGFSAPGTYNLVWTVASGCFDQITVVVGSSCNGCNISNNFITAPTEVSFCESSGNLFIDGNTAGPVGGTYTWQYSVNNNSYVNAPGTFNQEDYNTPDLSAGNYSFRRIYTTTGAQACSDTSNLVQIEVIASPLIPTSINAIPNPVCLGSSATVSVTNVIGTVYTWVASSPSAGLATSTSNSVVMTPTIAGTYTISVKANMNGCTSESNSIDVVAVATPSAPVNVLGNNPTACGGSNGSIVISSLPINTTYIVMYLKNGNSASGTFTSNASGILTITGLTAGTYSNIRLSVGSCISDPYAGPIVLTDPGAPEAPLNIQASQTNICANETVSISVTNNPGAVYTWTTSNPGVLGIQSPSTTNSITMIGLSGGSAVVSVTQNVAGCTSPAASITINVAPSPPTPSAATITKVNPTQCEGTDGTITLSGLAPSTIYTVHYQRNGVDQMASITSTAGGLVVITGLNAATYTQFQLTNANNCSSGIYSGPVILSDPGNTTPSNLVVSPNPVCLGQNVNVSVLNIPGATYSWAVSSDLAGLNSSTSNTASLLPIEPGTYTISVTQTLAGCVSPPASMSIVVRDDCYNPDFGVTYEAIPLTGILSTNDVLAPGATYGNPIANPSNPSSCMPTVSSNGAYSFVCTTPGEYYFIVPVCRNGENCINIPLAITILVPESTTNPPVANHDYMTTNENTPVRIPILANDKCQSVPNCNLGNPTIVTSAMHGSFNLGTMIYTPNSNYVGLDSFKYQVCQIPTTSPTSCDEEWVYVTIIPSFGGNYTNGMDDYGQTNKNAILVANVTKGTKTNDVDPEGDNTSINPFTKSVTGKGSITMSSDGSYTFTPALDFIGPVDFAYQVCDNKTPAACDSATLHILVDPSLPSGSIGDFVWHDTNGDGLQSSGEQGIPGVIVQLYNENNQLVQSTTTDNTGKYLFESVLVGNYYLKFLPSSEFDITTPLVGSDRAKDNNVTEANGANTTDLITLSAGETNLTIDAGFYKCAKIGSLVWYDVDKDDIWDPTENGLNGMRVELWRKVNGVFTFQEFQYTGHKPNTPSDDGYFNFCTIPGEYYVKVVMPPIGLVQAKPNVLGYKPLTNPTEQTNDSDLTNTFGQGTTESFVLTSGAILNNIGAGYYPMAQVGNLVWVDQNTNGIQDSNEPKMAGVLVEAFDAETLEPLGQSVTDDNGVYNINYLEKRQVFLQFTPPAGYSATVSNVGDNAINSDVDHSFGLNTTTAYQMIPEVSNFNIDLGLAFGVLPVNWVSVDANAVEDGHLINWEVSREVNLDYYEVERRGPSDDEFQALPNRISPKNAADRNVYSYLDADITKLGRYVYRIKQVDIDGKYTYSKMVSVLAANTSSASFYPNPTRNAVNIEYNLDQKSNVSAELLGSDGKLFKKLIESTELNKGYHSYNVVLSEIPNGVYLLKMNFGDTEKMERIIILE